MITQHDPKFAEESYILRLDMSQNSRNRVPKIIQGSTTQPLEPPARRQYFQHYRKNVDFNLQYFQDSRKYKSEISNISRI